MCVCVCVCVCKGLLARENLWGGQVFLSFLLHSKNSINVLLDQTKMLMRSNEFKRERYQRKLNITEKNRKLKKRTKIISNQCRYFQK